MKNLENYGVQTLSAKEISTISGGQTTPPPGWDPSQEAVDLGTVTNRPSDINLILWLLILGQ